MSHSFDTAILIYRGYPRPSDPGSATLEVVALAIHQPRYRIFRQRLFFAASAINVPDALAQFQHVAPNLYRFYKGAPLRCPAPMPTFPTATDPNTCVNPSRTFAPAAPEPLWVSRKQRRLILRNDPFQDKLSCLVKMLHDSAHRFGL